MNFFITLKILGVVHHLYVFSPFSPSILKPNLKIQGRDEINYIYLISVIIFNYIFQTIKRNLNEYSQNIYFSRIFIDLKTKKLKLPLFLINMYSKLKKKVHTCTLDSVKSSLMASISLWNTSG